MPLEELQRQFAAFLRDPTESGIAQAVSEDWLAPEEHLSVYRNNFRLGLTEALAANFPVTVELVDRSFFEPVAWSFIQRYPPTQPSLFAYGEKFPDFLADIEALKEYPFVPEMARFEYLMNKVTHALQVPQSRVVDRAAITPEKISTFAWHPAPELAWMETRFPLGAIWEAHRIDRARLADLQISEAPQWLILYRLGEKIFFASISKPEYRFLEILQETQDLLQAGEAAALEEALDLARWLGLLLGRNLLYPLPREGQEENEEHR